MVVAIRRSRASITMRMQMRKTAPGLGGTAPATHWSVLLAYGLGLGTGAAAIVGLGFLGLLMRTYAGSDFAGFWAAPRMYLNGIDPYDPAVYGAAVAQLGVQSPDWTIFGYPPWVVFALLPFGALPVGTATVIWTIGGGVSAMTGVWMLLRAAAPGSRLIAAVAGALLFGSPPAIYSFLQGQWSFFLVGTSAAMMALFIAGRHRSAGLLSAVLLLKPHLFLFTAVGLTRSAFARHRAGAVAVAATAALVVIGVTILARPTWFSHWLLQIPDRAASHRMVTLTTALGDVFGLGNWVALALLLAAFLAALTFDPRGNASLAVWTALSSTAVIYGYSYDHLLLVVPLVIASGVAHEISVRRGRVLTLLGGSVVYVGELALHQVAAARPDQSQSLNALVPLAVLALVILALWPARHFSERRPLAERFEHDARG